MDIIAVNIDNPKLKVEIDQVKRTTFCGRILEGGGVYPKGHYAINLSVKAFYVAIPFSQFKNMIKLLTK